mgnify:CR=1 FL=1
MSKTLITLANEAHELKLKIIEADGEITPDIEQALEVSSQSLAKKTDSYKYIMDDFEKYAEMLKEREDQISRSRKALENCVKRLKENIKHAMVAVDMNQISGDEYVFKLSNSKPSLVITDEKLVPKDFKYQVVSEEIDKDKLKKEIELIGNIEGAELRENKSLRITINKGV